MSEWAFFVLGRLPVWILSKAEGIQIKLSDEGRGKKYLPAVKLMLKREGKSERKTVRIQIMQIIQYGEVNMSAYRQENKFHSWDGAAGVLDQTFSAVSTILSVFFPPFLLQLMQMNKHKKHSSLRFCTEGQSYWNLRVWNCRLTSEKLF